jgi:hypothetical protein
LLLGSNVASGQQAMLALSQSLLLAASSFAWVVFTKNEPVLSRPLIVAASAVNSRYDGGRIALK